jgi:hypothetical protein
MSVPIVFTREAPWSDVVADERDEFLRQSRENLVEKVVGHGIGLVSENGIRCVVGAQCVF